LAKEVFGMKRWHPSETFIKGEIERKKDVNKKKGEKMKRKTKSQTKQRGRGIPFRMSSVESSPVPPEKI